MINSPLGVAVVQVVFRAGQWLRRTEVLAALEAEGAHVVSVDDEHAVAEVTVGADHVEHLRLLPFVACARTTFTYLAAPARIMRRRAA